MIKELSTWIVSRVNALAPPETLTIGGNVQIGFRAQDAPVRCHVFVETGGPADFYLADKVDYMLQIVSRDEDHQTARGDAWAIFDALHGTAGWQIPALVSGGQAYEAQVIEALAIPYWLGQDEKGNHEFTMNFLCRMIKA